MLTLPLITTSPPYPNAPYVSTARKEPGPGEKLVNGEPSISPALAGNSRGCSVAILR